LTLSAVSFRVSLVGIFPVVTFPVFLVWVTSRAFHVGTLWAGLSTLSAVSSRVFLVEIFRVVTFLVSVMSVTSSVA